MSRIADEPRITKHNKEIQFFNDLVIDLKLQLLAKPSREPIDMERMEEATRMIAKLAQCKENMCWKR